MATRFGAVSPAHTYAAKVRWLVGGLVAIIFVLLITLVFLAQSSSPPPAQPLPDENVAEAANDVLLPGVEILTTLQRIEEGQLLDVNMLSTQRVDPERIPEGAVLASQKNLVIGKWARNMIAANMPVVSENLTEVRPINKLNIPPGYRAVTITVDARAGVEGWAKPNTRVDVLWAYEDRDGKKKVATIVRFTKVLSVAGQTVARDGKAEVGGPTTVTLLTTEQDAKKIELARTLGALSLSLVGDQEQHRIQEAPDPVTIDTILGLKPAVSKEDPHDGVMYTRDPKTGKQIRYVLRRGQWVRDTGF